MLNGKDHPEFSRSGQLGATARAFGDLEGGDAFLRRIGRTAESECGFDGVLPRCGLTIDERGRRERITHELFSAQGRQPLQHGLQGGTARLGFRGEYFIPRLPFGQVQVDERRLGGGVGHQFKPSDAGALG